MRELKFRAWSTSSKIMYELNPANKDGAALHDLYEGNSGTWKVMQYTGLKDKNGVDVYEGDIVAVFFKWNEYFTRAIYEISINSLDGIHLNYKRLYGENNIEGEQYCNQYPINTDVCVRYRTLTEDHRNGNYDKLAVKVDAENGYSNEIVIIGNVYQNPELLEQNHD